MRITVGYSPAHLRQKDQCVRIYVPSTTTYTTHSMTLTGAHRAPSHTSRSKVCLIFFRGVCLVCVVYIIILNCVSHLYLHRWSHRYPANPEYHTLAAGTWQQLVLLYWENENRSTNIKCNTLTFYKISTLISSSGFSCLVYVYYPGTSGLVHNSENKQVVRIHGWTWLHHIKCPPSSVVLRCRMLLK